MGSVHGSKSIRFAIRLQRCERARAKRGCRKGSSKPAQIGEQEGRGEGGGAEGQRAELSKGEGFSKTGRGEREWKGFQQERSGMRRGVEREGEEMVRENGKFGQQGLCSQLPRYSRVNSKSY